MSKPEYLPYRCCMCPNINEPENASCPKGTTCRFVKSYRDDQGRVLFVTKGFRDGRYWWTGYLKPNGSLRRLASPALPVRKERDEAQGDLNLWAQKKGLGEVAS